MASATSDFKKAVKRQRRIRRGRRYRPPTARQEWKRIETDIMAGIMTAQVMELDPATARSMPQEVRYVLAALKATNFGRNVPDKVRRAA